LIVLRFAWPRILLIIPYLAPARSSKRAIDGGARLGSLGPNLGLGDQVDADRPDGQTAYYGNTTLQTSCVAKHQLPNRASIPRVLVGPGPSPGRGWLCSGCVSTIPLPRLASSGPNAAGMSNAARAWQTRPGDGPGSSCHNILARFHMLAALRINGRRGRNRR